MSKEKWIDEILNSAKNIKIVEGDPWLASKVEAKLHRQKDKRTGIVPLHWVYATSFALLLILTINLFVWNKSVSTIKNKDVQQVMKDYDFSQNDIYSLNYSN
jgi:hypothetical protein